MKKLLPLLIFIFFFLPGNATIRNVPAAYSSIQSALNSCIAEDTVLVQPGIYYENIIWPDTSAIKLFSAGDSSNTFIEGNNNGTVIWFDTNGNIDTTTIIMGFTIRHGFVHAQWAGGAGIFIFESSPKIVSCRITANHLASSDWGYGAGVFCNYSNPVFENSSISLNCVDSSKWGQGGGIYITDCDYIIFRNVSIDSNIVNCTTWNYGSGAFCKKSKQFFENVSISGNISADSSVNYEGAGIYLDRDTAEFVNVKIQNNSNAGRAGFGLYMWRSHANLTNVLIADNYTRDSSNVAHWGGGITLEGYSPYECIVTMINVTVTGNKRLDGGLVVKAGLYAEIGSIVSITNSIFWNPTAGGGEITQDSLITVNYSDIRTGYVGTGNININPAFVTPTDFHLSTSSPCINSGTLPGSPSFDLDNFLRPAPVGTNPDMGCYELNQPLSVNEINDNIFSIEAFPNPSNNVLTIQFPYGIKNIEIYDMVGQKIPFKQLPDEFGKGQTSSNNFFQTKIDVSAFPNGIYFVTVDNGKEKAVRKFVKE